MDDNLRCQKAIEEVAEYIVDYPAFHDLRAKMEGMLRSPNQRGLLIVGDTRVGKTTLAQSFLDAHPPSIVDGRPSVPVLYIEVPTIPSEKSIARGLMSAIDINANPRLTEQELSTHFAKVARYCRIKLVIIDEFHHFLETGYFPRLVRFANSVKGLMNQSGVSVVLMGLPKSRTILDKNQQLRGRFSSVLRIGTLAMDDPRQFNVFLDVLQALAARLPFENAEEIADPQYGMRMWYATHGALGYIKALLIEAIELSQSTARHQLTMPLLEKAFTAAIWCDGVGRLNPFHRDFRENLLNAVGEPFCPDMAF